MKINTLFTRLGLLSLAAFALASCNKYKEPDFAITGNYFIVQTNTGTGESMSSTFEPYIYIMPAYTNQSIKSLQITKSGIPLYSKQVGNVFQTEGNAFDASSLDGLNGTYSVSATDPEGKSASLQFSIDNKADRELGELVVNSLKCANGMITASWEPVKNATHVGLMICPKIAVSDFVSGYFPFNNFYPQNDTQASNSCTFDITGTIYSNYDLEVRVVASNRIYGSLTGMICVEDDHVKTILKGQKEFEEGDYPEIVPGV